MIAGTWTLRVTCKRMFQDRKIGPGTFFGISFAWVLTTQA